MFSGWTPRYGGSSGYPPPPPADPGLQSFRDQHLAQLEQLQKMHQRQMESVLPVPPPMPPRPFYPPRQPYPYPPPYSHNVPPPGYQSPALPPDTDKPPPPLPTTEQPPPPPPQPESGTPANSTSLEEQQQYWYNQHLLNLQQKAKSHGGEAPPLVQETAVPPSAGYVPVPPAQQPPPPPVEEAKPPLPVENVGTGINLSEDPEQAQRLKTLQEAAAHWQQHEQHRLGFQYQGIMQKHSAMQQMLQRYQQIIQEPPHMAAMTVDVQIQHYEMEQKQLVPLQQEWESQFKKWQELLQTYPHKDQLHEYQVQWASWQTHIKATKAHLKDKVASLKNLKQQYGGSHYISGIAMVPQYTAYSPVMPPAVPPALPTGVGIQPPYTAPLPPVYGTVPPPPLPPVATYSEATPPLPPVTAPPLPPASSAPPPPPPVSSPLAEVVQPPLPPSGDTQPPPPAASSISAHEPQATASVTTPVPPSFSSSLDITTSSSTLPPAPSDMPPPAIDPPTTTEAFVPGNQTITGGLSCPAQQALRNTQPPLLPGAPPVPSYNPLLGHSAPPVPSYIPPLGQSAPPVPTYNPPQSQSAPPVPSYNPPQSQSAPPIPSYNPPQGQSAPPVPSYNPPQGESAPPVPSFNPLKDQSAPPVPSYNPPLGHSARPVSSDNPILGQNAFPVPSHNTQSDVSSGLQKQNEDTKQLNPPGPPPDQELMPAASPSPAAMKTGGPYEGPSEPRFAAQGHNIPPPRFPPPGSHGFHGSRSTHVRENQHWANEQMDQSTPKDQPGQSWDKPPAKEMPDYPPGPMLDRESNRLLETWKRPDGLQPNRKGNQGDDMGSKWDQPPEGRLSGSKEPPSDRWSNSQDRWGVESTSSPMDRFGDAQNFGSNRFGGPDVGLFERYGDSMGSPYDRHGASEVPFRERFGHPDGSQRFRFNAPEMQPRGRARFSATPPRGRFPFPESHPRHRFGAPEGRAPSFGYTETPPKDRFGGPELSSPQDHMGGQEQPSTQERFRGSEQLPSQERFGGPEPPSYQQGLRDPKIPPPHHRFGGPDIPTPRGRFVGHDLPQAHDQFGSPDVPDRFKAPEFPPLRGDRFKGPEITSAPGERFKGPDMTPPPGDRFKGPEMTPDSGDRFTGPKGTLTSGDRFKGPEMPPTPGDCFKGPEVHPPSVDLLKGPGMSPASGDHLKGPEKSPPEDRLKNPEVLSPCGDHFGVPEMPSSRQPSSLGDFDGPLRNNWNQADKDSFGAPEVPLHDRQDNRVPFSDKWGSRDRKGRPEWAQGRGEGVNRPSLLGDSPQEKAKIHGNTENAPIQSYQSQFNKKQVPKETEVRLGSDSFPDGQRDAKQDEKDVTIKQVDKPSKEDALKVESQADQDASKTATAASSEGHKPDEAVDFGKDKTKDSDLPETDPLGGQTLPLLSKADEPLSSSASSDSSKGPSQIENVSTSNKGEIVAPSLSKPSVSQLSVSEATKPNTPVSTLTISSKPEEPTDGPSSVRKMDAFQNSSSGRTGGLLPTPTTGMCVPFGPHATPPFRPQAPHSMPPIRPGDPWAPPVRPGDPWAPPVRPSDPWGPPVRPGGPRGAPPVRPGGPRGAPPVRPGGPWGAPLVRPGGPWGAPPPVRPGGPRAPPPVRPGGPRAPPPIRPGGPRAAPPVRPGGPRVPFSAWEEPLERMVQGKDRNVYAASMEAEETYDEEDEEVMGEEHSHGSEGHYNRPEFPHEEADDAGDYFHHEPGRPGGFREGDASFKPEPYEGDWPENYDMRFDHRGRGRARGFMRGRPPPRPGSREVMDVLDDRGFEPRGHLPDERPLFREGLNEPPQFGREPFHRESRFADRERSLDPPLEGRRRDFALEEGRLDDWERERLWRARDPELLRDPYMDIYMRDERLPSRPPLLPHDLDVRRDPWHDRHLDKDMDRLIGYNRLERPYLFERDLDQDYPRIPEDLDLPHRDRDWLPTRRPLSPHRPFSPVRARSPLPPLPPIDRYLDDRWRLDRELVDRDFRDRGELRIREYPERPLWNEDRNSVLLSERSELEPRDDRWYPPEERVRSESLNPVPSHVPVDPSSAALPEQPVLPGEASTGGVLALSQRQHEIILKAAQELKMLREQKEQLDNLKQYFGDPESSDTGKPASGVRSRVEPQQPPSDIPASGGDPASSSLAAPAAGKAAGDPFSSRWEEERRRAHSAGLPVGSKLSGIQQTVDYAHGRDLAIGKVEQTPYGERVMLLPEPGMDRGGILPYQKDFLIDSFDRDFRDRDPYFERMKSADRRDYERDRLDAHRDRSDHDRDRDRHSRDDRSSYRDKESSSRRGNSDKSSYDRKADRPPYDVPSSYGGNRRNYPEERPVLAPPVPPPEKKPETRNVDDLLKRPGRDSRPDRIVVIMRGLPGSGKTHVAKLIRDKEVEFGGSAPRVLSLDDYFITEVEKVEKDPESGKKVKRKVMEYEYEPEMEDTYRSGMLKAFKKTLDDGFFPFIILDSIHDRVRHFEQFWSAAKTKGFEVYLAEITADTQTCTKRNVHGRKLKEINKMAENWEPAPRHMIRLDIRSLLQDAAIEEVEMEDSEPSVEPQKDEKKESAEEDDNDRGYLPKSKWEMDTSEAKLDKLDGLKVNKRKRDYGSMASRMEDYLQLPDDYDTRESEPGKKRVRWADLEEKKDADRKRAIGFVVGQTDWEKITDKSGHLAERALNRTKYI